MTEIRRLKKQIRQKELKINAQKKLIHQEYQHLKNQAISPAGLFIAFLAGFMMVYSDKKLHIPQLTGFLLTAKNLFSLLT